MKSMGICYVVGAGEFGGELFQKTENDLVIACDGGYLHCRDNGIEVDLVIGDFDSLSYVPEHPRVIQLRPEKDETDTEWAVAEGLRQGYREFVIYGGIGGRISHTLANIQLLTDLAVKGCSGVLVGKDSWYRVIHNDELVFDEHERGYLSVFCLGDVVEGVYETGLKYELKDAVLKKECPIGVSNEFMGIKSRVSVRKGTLLLIKESKE